VKINKGFDVVTRRKNPKNSSPLVGFSSTDCLFVHKQHGCFGASSYPSRRKAAESAADNEHVRFICFGVLASLLVLDSLLWTRFVNMDQLAVLAFAVSHYIGRTVDLAHKAPDAIPLIGNNRLLFGVVPPDHIHKTGFDAGSTAGTFIQIDFNAGTHAPSVVYPNT
jgi:hypothetical protein